MGGGFSVELCGGTHVRRTGDIGLFRIVSESGIAAGVRRIEAVSGLGALEWVNAAEAEIKELARALKAGRREVAGKVRALIERERELQREIEQLNARLASRESSALADRVERVEGVQVLAAQIQGGDAKALLTTLDALKSKLGSAAILLAHVDGGEVSLIAGVTSDLTGRLKAGDAIKALAPLVGARGGGRPDMARAGGGDKADAIQPTLDAFKRWVAERLRSAA
jgi:alanyl-tRNA synthetase